MPKSFSHSPILSPRKGWYKNLCEMEVILEKLLADFLIQSKVMFEVLNDPGNRFERQRISDIFRPWAYQLQIYAHRFPRKMQKTAWAQNSIQLHIFKIVVAATWRKVWPLNLFSWSSNPIIIFSLRQKSFGTSLMSTMLSHESRYYILWSSTKNSNNYTFSCFTKAQRHQILRKIIDIRFSKLIFQF